MATNVQHDAQRQRFYIDLEGDDAELTYSRRGEALDFQHVFVPPTHRGQGLAEQLAKTAFEYAKAEGYDVVPTCPYIAQTYLRRHPEYQDMVQRGG